VKKESDRFMFFHNIKKFGHAERHAKLECREDVWSDVMETSEAKTRREEEDRGKCIIVGRDEKRLIKINRFAFKRTFFLTVFCW